MTTYSGMGDGCGVSTSFGVRLSDSVSSLYHRWVTKKMKNETKKRTLEVLRSPAFSIMKVSTWSALFSMRTPFWRIMAVARAGRLAGYQLASSRALRETGVAIGIPHICEVRQRFLDKRLSLLSSRSDGRSFAVSNKVTLSHR